MILILLCRWTLVCSGAYDLVLVDPLKWIQIIFRLNLLNVI